MSLLLDALRKSEQQRRLGETPSIQVPSLGQANKARTGIPKLWLVLSAVLLLTVLWLIVSPFNGADDNTPALTAAAENADTQPVTGQLPETVEQTLPQQPPDTLNQQVAAATEQLGNTLPTAIGEQNLEQPVSDFNALATEIARREANTREEQNQAAESTTGHGQDPATAAALPVEQALDITADAPVESEPEWQPERPSHLNYFELPVNVRQKLPDLPISIRVYDDAPAKRFVIINRARVQEGDTIPEADDVKLLEIRRESLILEFEGYVFEY